MTDPFPGQRLLHPVPHFVFSYRLCMIRLWTQSPTPPETHAGLALGRASFIVFHCLKQLVPDFAHFLVSPAFVETDLSELRDPDTAGGRSLVGRRKSFAPIDLTRRQDDPKVEVFLNPQVQLATLTYPTLLPGRTALHFRSGLKVRTDQSWCETLRTRSARRYPRRIIRRR